MCVPTVNTPLGGASLVTEAIPQLSVVAGVSNDMVAEHFPVSELSTVSNGCTISGNS